MAGRSVGLGTGHPGRWGVDLERLKGLGSQYHAITVAISRGDPLIGDLKIKHRVTLRINELQSTSAIGQLPGILSQMFDHGSVAGAEGGIVRCQHHTRVGREDPGAIGCVEGERYIALNSKPGQVERCAGSVLEFDEFALIGIEGPVSPLV